jgi:tetratricopeptide (TPR) repeat protein
MNARILLLAVSIVALTGCAFHGALRPQLYEQRPAQGQIPLKVALVVAEPFRSQRLVFTTLNVREIALNPGLSDAIKLALSRLFREVIVTDSVNGAGNADLLVVPSADIQRFRPVALALAFREPRTQAVVGTYDAATTVNWADPPEAGMAAFLTGFSLFTLSPLTLNWEASASGNNAIERAQEGIARDLDIISSRIRGDGQRLVAVVQAGSISEWAKACDDRNDVQRRIRGCTELISRAEGRPGLQASAYSERAAAYVQSRDLDRASADVEQALRLEPRHIWAHYYRGRVAEARRQYDRAARDYDQAAALIEASVAAKPDQRLRESGASIRGRAREMEARAGMEQRWVEYLKTIQASNDYENWSGPPYDLYRQSQR